MLDFRKLAKLAGLNDDLIDDLAKELNIEGDVQEAYNRGQKETLNRVNTLVEITLLAVKNNPALREVAETLKKWMKEGIQPLDTPVNTSNAFIQLDDRTWYHPDKMIVVYQYNKNTNTYTICLPHIDRVTVESDLEPLLQKLS